jgi:hypothetical protein
MDPVQIASVVRASTRVPSRPSRLTLARLALVLVAVGQIVIAVPALFYGRDHTAPMHVAHELGSFDLALAVGFLIAAWRPERARGMSPLVGAVALLLAVTALSDLIGGRTSLGDEAPHLLAVVAWLLLVYVAAEAPPSTAEPGGLKTALISRRARAEQRALRARPIWLPRGITWRAALPGSASRSYRRRDVA